jgi:hypothetical protein
MLINYIKLIFYILYELIHNTIHISFIKYQFIINNKHNSYKS